MTVLWEQEDFQCISGEVWRPGGLALTRHAVELAEQCCVFNDNPRLLDLGCGAGASAAFLADRGYTVLGLDRHIHTTWTTRKRERKNLHFLQADATGLPLAESSMDVVCCECVLSLLADPLLMLRRCHQILHVGGALLLSELFLRTVRGREKEGDGILLFSSCLDGARRRDVWEAMLTSAGFALLHFEDHSRALRDLAARLLWYGVDLPRGRHDLCRCRAFGYGLWIARKENGPSGSRLVSRR